MSALFVECLEEGRLDHPFQNHFGRLEAGVNENDAVVAPSFTPPFLQPVLWPAGDR